MGYDHPHFGRFPTVVSSEHGQGRITTVGTVPNPALAADLVRWLVPERDPMWNAPPASVTVHSATNAAGERIHVIHNWNWTPARLTLPKGMIDILAVSDLPIQDLELGPGTFEFSPSEAARHHHQIGQPALHISGSPAVPCRSRGRRRPCRRSACRVR